MSSRTCCCKASSILQNKQDRLYPVWRLIKSHEREKQKKTSVRGFFWSLLDWLLLLETLPVPHHHHPQRLSEETWGIGVTFNFRLFLPGFPSYLHRTTTWIFRPFSSRLPPVPLMEAMVAADRSVSPRSDSLRTPLKLRLAESNTPNGPQKTSQRCFRTGRNEAIKRRINPPLFEIRRYRLASRSKTSR